MIFVKSLNDSLVLIYMGCFGMVCNTCADMGMAQGVCCLGVGEDMVAVVMCYNLHLSVCRLRVEGLGGGCDMIQ